MQTQLAVSHFDSQASWDMWKGQKKFEKLNSVDSLLKQLRLTLWIGLNLEFY